MKHSPRRRARSFALICEMAKIKSQYEKRVNAIVQKKAKP